MGSSCATGSRSTKLGYIDVDVAIQSDRNIRKKEQEKFEKYKGLKEELEKMWVNR